MLPTFRLAPLLVAFFALTAATVRSADPPRNASLADAQRALKQFRVPAGIEGRVWATDPLLANPVCFAFDEQGRCFVAETYRLHHGVTDNRQHMYWLDDDLACRTVEDRVAMYRKHAKEKFASTYEKDEDRVKLIWDSTGAGVADKSSVFADGFRTAATGIGAGLLAHKGNVYYTNIPDLWLMKDTKGEGAADVRESLATGFGVHVAFLGHDLHGLRMGPDGRIYFSSGDRGLNVRTKEGRHLDYTMAGCVLRCEPDGSNLEIVHRGLRNPQELAFDTYGNLFTVDNNSDSGDQARLVYIAEGADSGWRMHYQYGSRMSDRGPFNAEKIWHLKDQPAYIVPPLAHLTSGPSGLCFNPGGAALPEKYADHFFVCDFRGGADNSGVWAFTVNPKGAAFELTKKEEFVWRVLATDCDFAPDGGFYVSDWIQGWEQPGKGRLYRFADPSAEKKPVVAEVKKLLAEGFDQRPNDELSKLLEYPDMRVRQEAQFALAAKGERAVGALTAVAGKQAQTPAERVARFHAIWGLGQLGRIKISVRDTLARLAGDHDSEVRAQAVRTLGDLAAPYTLTTPLLNDAEPRVRYFAALALARTLRVNPDQVHLDADAERRLRGEVMGLVRDNADQDGYLRHALVSALAELHPEAIENVASETVPARLAVVLALRRKAADHSALLATFLTDPEPRVAVEAARAIHDESDLSLTKELPALAALVKRPKSLEPILWRALNANYRLGRPENAAALAAFAAAPDAPEKLRVEAIAMLGDWAKPAGRDRILGDWRPLPGRDARVAAEAFRPRLGGVFSGADKLRKEAVRVAAKLGIKEVAQTLREMAGDERQPALTRIEALRALDSLLDPKLDELLPIALKASSPRVRAEALRMTALRQPDQAADRLREALQGASITEAQAALATLAELKRPDADAVLAAALDRMSKGEIKEELHLDLIEAATSRKSADLATKLSKYEKTRPARDPLARFRETLLGGDAERGRDVFLNKAEVTCVKCHKLNGVGGDVGPELAGIGSKQKRDYLLESIVLPDKQIAKGYDSVVLDLSNGKSVTGVLKGEDAESVMLMTAEGQLLKVRKDTIDERRRGKSPMPEDVVQKLSPRELRDLVEFLASLKEEKK